jgi:hypothetical protein
MPCRKPAGPTVGGAHGARLPRTVRVRPPMRCASLAAGALSRSLGSLQSAIRSGIGCLCANIERALRCAPHEGRWQPASSAAACPAAFEPAGSPPIEAEPSEAEPPPPEILDCRSALAWTAALARRTPPNSELRTKGKLFLHSVGVVLFLEPPPGGSRLVAGQSTTLRVRSCGQCTNIQACRVSFFGRLVGPAALAAVHVSPAAAAAQDAGGGGGDGSYLVGAACLPACLPAVCWSAVCGGGSRTAAASWHLSAACVRPGCRRTNHHHHGSSVVVMTSLGGGGCSLGRFCQFGAFLSVGRGARRRRR